jgi:hypothetical protein
VGEKEQERAGPADEPRWTNTCDVVVPEEEKKDMG